MSDTLQARLDALRIAFLETLEEMESKLTARIETLKDLAEEADKAGKVEWEHALRASAADYHQERNKVRDKINELLMPETDHPDDGDLLWQVRPEHRGVGEGDAGLPQT